MLIGIDPGMKGAIAVKYKYGTVKFFDIPSYKNTDGETDVDLIRLRKILKDITAFIPQNEKVVVICEKSMGMAFTATKQRGGHFDNSKTAWKKGYNYGIIKAFFALYLIPFNYTPRPADWKRDLGITDGSLTYAEKKTLARKTAIMYYPEFEDELKRVKDSDRAEALLLTVWAEKKGFV